MYFKLMNGRETYLEGMRELLEERAPSGDFGRCRGQGGPGAQRRTGNTGGSVDGADPGRRIGPENHVVLTDYSCEMAGGLKRGKAVLRACGKTFLFRALMTDCARTGKCGMTMHAGCHRWKSYSHRENVYLDKNGIMLDCSRNSVAECGNP